MSQCKNTFFSQNLSFFFKKNTRLLHALHWSLCHNKKKRIPNGTLLLCIYFFATSTFRKIHVLFAKLMVGLQKYIRKNRVRKNYIFATARFYLQ